MMMPNRTDKDISFLICTCLDNFGFKKENVSARSRFFEEMYTKLGCNQDVFRIIPVGSSGEGLSLSSSDKDFMSVCKDVVCTDQGSDSEDFLTLLETDYTSTAPGYTKAVCTNQRLEYSPLGIGISKYTSVANYPYVSSAKLKIGASCILSKLNDTLTTNGPALTTVFHYETQFDEEDIVYSVYFYGSDNLLKWATRRRLYNWPSAEMVKKISDMEGFIVPVGDKESENQHLEWRICYTTAEKELVSSLNDIQIKLYVLLKLVAKCLLKPVCKALTSYVVKNVVFWIVEGTHPEQFSRDNLVGLLLKSLHFIKCCLENNHFPNYMIPERNLLRGSICGREKQNVINFLSNCLTEGGTVILRVPKLYQCVSYMATNPENVIMFGKWRDEVEKVKNEQFLLIVTNVDIDFDISSLLKFSDLGPRLCPELVRDACEKIVDKRYVTNCMKLFFVVVPDILSLILSGKSLHDLVEIYCSRLRAITFL